jgi:hypothetical protein
MSLDELREKVARAMAPTLYGGEEYRLTRADLRRADAALAVVREAMREPTMAMLRAVGETDDKAFAGGNAHGADFEWLWAVALAASPLAEPGKGLKE